MSTTPAESVSFSDLSRNPRAVAEKASTFGSVRVTHRDAEDFVLTKAAVFDRWEESLSTASRIFLALMKQPDGLRSLRGVLPEVYPWVRHLSEQERHAFLLDVVGALSDHAEIGTVDALHQAVVSWRATARILADPAQAADAVRPLSGVELGPVEVVE